MAAFFYTYGPNDVFKTIPGDNSSLISIEFLDTLVKNKSALAIYTDIQFQSTEINQLFPTFDNKITYLQFGKGVGAINVSGIIFSACDHTVPGIAALYSSFQSMRNQKVAVSMAGITFFAIVASATCNITGEPDTMAQFQISLQTVEDTNGS
jgi:hypothetical protein